MSFDGPRLAPLSGSKPNALVILAHGTDDDVVPFRSMDLASIALTAAGGSTTKEYAKVSRVKSITTTKGLLPSVSPKHPRRAMNG